MKKIIILDGQIAEKGAEEITRRDVEITVLNDDSNCYVLKFLIEDKEIRINRRELIETLDIFDNE